MFCKFCGQKSQGTGFCTGCGKALPLLPHGQPVDLRVAIPGPQTTPTTVRDPRLVSDDRPGGVQVGNQNREQGAARPNRRPRRKSGDVRSRPRLGRMVALVAGLIIILGGAGGAIWWLLLGGPGGVGEDSQAGQGTYGSNVALDDLWDRCKAGVLADCDELYFASPSGSEYERFGASCGNREGSPGLCAPRGDDPRELEGGFGSDPELDLLWLECDEGNMFACDDLFLESPPGTAYEEFGASCGNRGLATGDCIGRF